MAQLVNGRVKEYIARENTSLPPARANIGINPPDNIVRSQLTDEVARLEAAWNSDVDTLNAANAAQDAAIAAAIAGVNNRITTLESRVVDIYAVAARVEAVPTAGQIVPGVNTTAGTDDWQSWVLVDYGVADARNGFYSLSGGTVVKQDIDYRAGLEIFVDGGTYANSNWRISDEPDAGGAFPIIPWSRVEDLQVLNPSHLHIEANRIRSDINTDYFNQVSGILDFSDAQKAFVTSTGTRLSALETGLADNNATDAQQNVRLTSLEASDSTQNATLTTQGQQINALTTRVNTAETDIDNLEAGLAANNAKDATQDGQIATLQSDLTGLGSRVTTTEGNITTLQSGLAANNARDDGQDGQITNLISRLDSNDQLDQTQNQRLDQLQSGLNANNARDDNQDAVLTNHTNTLNTYGTRITTAENSITEQGNRLTTAEGNITNLQTGLAANNTRDDGQDTTLTTHASQLTDLTGRLTTAERDIDSVETAIAANNVRDDGQDAILTAHTATLTDLGTRLTANEALDATQDGRLTATEANVTTLQTGLAANDAKDATQDGQIATLQTDVAARQTENQVRALYRELQAYYNPVYQLLDGAGGVARVVGTETIDGTVYTVTTYTITFVEAGFERTNIREHGAPYHAVRPPHEEYLNDGAAYRVTFYDTAAIVDGAMRVAFHRPFAANF